VGGGVAVFQLCFWKFVSTKDGELGFVLVVAVSVVMV
jgi:hypothetical protein